MSNTGTNAIAKSKIQKKKHMNGFGPLRKYVTELVEFLKTRQKDLHFLSKIMSDIINNIWNLSNLFSQL